MDGGGRTQWRYLIQLEFALFHLTQGNIEEAHNSIKFLTQERASGSDPVVNMMAGLILYQLWYLGIPKEIQLRNVDTNMQSEAHQMEPGVVFHLKPEQVEYSDNHSTVNIQDVKPFALSTSGRSIADIKKMSIDTELHDQKASFDRDDNVIYSSISFPYGLETCLLPIQLQQSIPHTEYSLYLQREMVKEHYINAVKHLRLALYSTPPLLAALLPLIQLLLLGDQIEEALEELKKFCCNSNAVLPYRLRARLLECFSRKNPTVLSTCYEDILKKDPTCNYSLSVLIRMYKNGSYCVEPLLEMIALHLDATYATCDIWEEFASCFLKLQSLMKSQYDEDQMSTADHTNDNGAMQAKFTSSNTIPGVFTRGEARRSWWLRCRWWSPRHFSKNAFVLGMQAGEWDLLTFKASCASHLYGPEFEYANSVYTVLKKNGDEDRFLLLQIHLDNSLKLLENLNRTS
ncbi:uncharacterized protein LOC143884269 isoform X2 [Tasmannia lanceolata]|uniref:uncharacterized protein LOC143884269 isoform X2 n=1 Tax=Tasmannia lanceolata TaxID=3420 RepID=UPI004064BA08